MSAPEGVLDAPGIERWHAADDALAAGPVTIAGLGSIGRRHLANLESIGGPPPILLRSGHGADDLRRHRCTTRLEEAVMLGSRAVVVANPTSMHLATALEAARAGCHVLVEKPLAHTTEGIADLEAEVDAHGAVALVGYQFRFHPTLARVRNWLRSNAIGRVTTVRAHWGEYLPGWHPREDYRRGYSARSELGGGVLLTLSHPLDYLRWLLGDVTAVCAVAGRVSDLELDVEDSAHVLLRFASGALGAVSLDFVQRPPAHTLQLTGTRGTIRWDARTGTAHWYDATNDRTIAAHVPPDFERNTLFREEMRHFLACIAGRERPRCTLQDGKRAVRIATAALESAAGGGWISA